MDIQRAYIDHWDFKLIEPWYLKQTAEYQWKMYEGYRDDAKGILGVYKQKGADETLNVQTQARQRMNDYSDKYFAFFDQAVEIKDWRKISSRASITAGCTENNLTIPDTSGAFDEEKTPVPVDQDATSWV